MRLLPILQITQTINIPLESVSNKIEKNTELWIRNSKTFGNESIFNGYINNNVFKINIKNTHHLCKGSSAICNGTISGDSKGTTIKYTIWPGYFSVLFYLFFLILMSWAAIESFLNLGSSQTAYGIISLPISLPILYGLIYCSFWPRAKELNAAIYKYIVN